MEPRSLRGRQDVMIGCRRHRPAAPRAAGNVLGRPLRGPAAENQVGPEWSLYASAS